MTIFARGRKRFEDLYIDVLNEAYERRKGNQASREGLASTSGVSIDDGAESRVPVDADARIAVVCHAFYIDIFAELLKKLENLPRGTDLYVSVTSQQDYDSASHLARGWSTGAVVVRTVSNRGRDIAPKYVEFSDVYDAGYDLILFLHTKKTADAALGDAWRSFLVESLIGSPPLVSAIRAAFEQNSSLGIVMPSEFGRIKSTGRWNGNFAAAKTLGQQMGIELMPWSTVSFPAGSMFWARPAALRRILTLDLRLTDFPEESGQVGGTIAHALERLVLYAAGADNFSYCVVTLPPDSTPLAFHISNPAIAKPTSGSQPSTRLVLWSSARAVMLIVEGVLRKHRARPTRVVSG